MRNGPGPHLCTHRHGWNTFGTSSRSVKATFSPLTPSPAAQCVGRAIRGKTDYGLMVFADKVRWSSEAPATQSGRAGLRVPGPSAQGLSTLTTTTTSGFQPG